MGPRNAKVTWFLTYPQNDASKETLRDQLATIDAMREYIIATEQHADGGNHLHAYVKFESGVTLQQAPTTFNVIGKPGNYQPCRSPKAVIEYVKKGGDYITNIDLQSYLNKKGKVTAAVVKEKTTKQAFEDGDIGFHSLKAYQYARSVVVEPYRHHEVRGYWIWGRPGVGKSYAVRQKHPELYLKAQNKWFDGYDGQKVILMDDLDAKEIFGHYLKIWADEYACSGEIKNGTVHLQHTHFYVTSNYRIEDLFSDPEMIDAIKRRFKVIHFMAPGQDLDSPLYPIFLPPMDFGIAN